MLGELGIIFYYFKYGMMRYLKCQAVKASLDIVYSVQRAEKWKCSSEDVSTKTVQKQHSKTQSINSGATVFTKHK